MIGEGSGEVAPRIGEAESDVPVDRALLALARRSFLCELSPATLKTVLAGAKTRDFAKRELVFREGDQAKWLAILLEGNVQLFGLGHDCREVALEILQPPAPIAQTTLCCDRMNGSSVRLPRRPSRRPNGCAKPSP